jgi:hypothetical protein
MLLPVAVERRDELSGALARLASGRPFAAAPSVHLARLVVLDTVPARRRPPPATVPLHPARLLFGVSVDGGLPVLVDELLPARAATLAPVFGCCTGCPGLGDKDAFLGWLDAHRAPAAISFATSTAPMARVRRALARQAGLRQLVIRAGALSPAELREAFDQVVQP